MADADVFMCLMNSGQSARLYDAYQSGGWLSVHAELVKILRVCVHMKMLRVGVHIELVKMLGVDERDRDEFEVRADQEPDRLARALEDVVEYLDKGYGLGRCSYVPADPPIPRDAAPEEVEEHYFGGFSREATVLKSTAAQLFSHYFLCVSARRIPQWCPDHTLAARQRINRQKELRRKRSGKYI